MPTTRPAPSATSPAVPAPDRADLEALALELTETVVSVLGSPDGQRVTHHKGVVLSGTFTATPRAREFSRATHLQGDEVPVTVRFSNGFPGDDGSGTSRDTTPGDPRGMAVKFHLPDGRTTDLVCQDWPVFPAGTPEKFRDLLRAQHDGEEATAAFLAEHPDVAAAGELVATVAAPPRSFAQCAYNSMNAFQLVDDAGAGQWVRWRLDPEAGVHPMPEDEWGSAERDVLTAGIVEQLPVRFRLLAQLAADGDQTTDPSQAWPAEREWAEMGTVEVTALDDTQEADGRVLVNDPMRLVDGIEPSDDPILRIRPLVYAESVRRRSAGGCPVRHL